MAGVAVTREEFHADPTPDQLGALWVRCNGGPWELYAGGVSRTVAYQLGAGLRSDARRNGDNVEPCFEPIGYDPNAAKQIVPAGRRAA